MAILGSGPSRDHDASCRCRGSRACTRRSSERGEGAAQERSRATLIYRLSEPGDELGIGFDFPGSKLRTRANSGPGASLEALAPALNQPGRRTSWQAVQCDVKPLNIFKHKRIRAQAAAEQTRAQAARPGALGGGARAPNQPATIETRAQERVVVVVVLFPSLPGGRAGRSRGVCSARSEAGTRGAEPSRSSRGRTPEARLDHERWGGVAGAGPQSISEDEGGGRSRWVERVLTVRAGRGGPWRAGVFGVVVRA